MGAADIFAADKIKPSPSGALIVFDVWPSARRAQAATVLAEQLLDGEAEGLIRKIIQKAKHAMLPHCASAQRPQRRVGPTGSGA